MRESICLKELKHTIDEHYSSGETKHQYLGQHAERCALLSLHHSLEVKINQ
jgi:hypothetical protein